MLTRFILTSVLLCHPLFAHALEEITTCRDFGNHLTPHQEKQFVQTVSGIAKKFSPKKNVAVCSGKGPLLVRLANSDVAITPVSKHGKLRFVETGWVFAFHQDFIDETPPELLKAVVYHEVGHLVLNHYNRCSLLFGNGDVYGYTVCEQQADIFAAKHVGPCTMARALRFVYDFLGKHSARSTYDEIIIKRAEKLESVGVC